MSSAQLCLLVQNIKAISLSKVNEIPRLLVNKNIEILLIKILLNRTCRNHYLDSHCTSIVMITEMMPEAILNMRLEYLLSQGLNMVQAKV